MARPIPTDGERPRTAAALTLFVMLLVGIVVVGAVVIVREQLHDLHSSRLAKPAIPVRGAYTGAWVNPRKLRAPEAQEAGRVEVSQLPSFTAELGEHVNILHVYSKFSSPLPVATLESIRRYGAIPMLDWACSNTVDIAAGRDDATIARYARGLRAFGLPVFLRWYWEMNVPTKPHEACKGRGGTRAADFVAAWRHIWQIFQEQGADNVAFVWSPSGTSNAARYYPGDQYVDWIGVDDYAVNARAAGTGARAVNSRFGDFYRQWEPRGKPMMIAETGAAPAQQAAFFRALQILLPSRYPDFKALIYFDSPGTFKDGVGSTLGAAGFRAFRALAHSRYFRPDFG